MLEETCFLAAAKPDVKAESIKDNLIRRYFIRSYDRRKFDRTRLVNAVKRGIDQTPRRLVAVLISYTSNNPGDAVGIALDTERFLRGNFRRIDFNVDDPANAVCRHVLLL